MIILQRPKSSWEACFAAPDRFNRATICGRKSRGEKRLSSQILTSLCSLSLSLSRFDESLSKCPGLWGPQQGISYYSMPKMLETRYVTLGCHSNLSHADFPARHYSYECKATTQERPYISRPSRTQQLQNPRLMPKLSNDVPDDVQRSYALHCFRMRGSPANQEASNGVADEILAKRDQERGRKRDLDQDEHRHEQSPKRTRSVSSHSVSTISTNRSASASPDRRSRHGTSGNGGRTSSMSPDHAKSRKRRYSDSSEGYSEMSHSGAPRRSTSREWADDRNIRRRRRESSPEERGRNRDSRRHNSRRHRSTNADGDPTTKERRSMTPDGDHGRSGGRSYRDREAPSGQARPAPSERSRQEPRARPNPPRQRSLSPYSKRLALTQSMNMSG